MVPPFIHKKLPYLAIALVYILGAPLDIMEVDAAQYASISLEMLKSGNWLEVLDRNEDYLDKPPLLFWLSALSFKLFGIGNWQYKLPSILFSILGLISTYNLGKRLYNERVGHYASLIFGSSFALIMINNDIKTDTILVSSIVFSLWMLLSAIETNQWKYFVGSALGISAAMLTKGPIGLMMPVLAIGGHVIMKRDRRSVLNARWLLVILLVAVALIPMCIGLYQQHGPEGLKFYFWTQSFGRITGESEWRNDTTPLYFFHVFAWSFLPWTLIGFWAIFRELASFRSSLKSKGRELYLISGIVLVWLALSMSKFKLPHYIFVVYPMVSILTAKYITDLKKSVRWSWTLLLTSSLAVLLLAFILIYAFPNGGWVIPLILVCSVGLASLVFLRSYRGSQVFWPSFILAIAIGLGLNLHFYPQLLPYQANASVGKWVKETGIENDKFFGFATGGRALDFYAGRIVPWMVDATSAIEAINEGTVVYANQARRDDLIKRGHIPEQEVMFENFEVQRLTLRFLNPKTREQAVKMNYLMFY